MAIQATFLKISLFLRCHELDLAAAHADCLRRIKRSLSIRICKEKFLTAPLAFRKTCVTIYEAA